MSKPESFETLATYKSRSLPLIDEAKEQGHKIAGLFCVYAPTELMYAAGVIPVGLCGKNQTPIPAAERDLPANLCPLIKSSYGYGITDSCPFFGASDFIVGETTCDGKKKMYELLERIKPLHLMHLPYSQKDESSLAFWTGELHKFAAFWKRKPDIGLPRMSFVRKSGCTTGSENSCCALPPQARHPFPLFPAWTCSA